jgi:hypothetical protein
MSTEADMSSPPPESERQHGETSSPSDDGERGQAREQQQQQPGKPSPGLKDKDAPTSDSYGDTRDSGDPASR